jgi:hypothetical protein
MNVGGTAGDRDGVDGLNKGASTQDKADLTLASVETETADPCYSKEGEKERERKRNGSRGEDGSELEEMRGILSGLAAKSNKGALPFGVAGGNSSAVDGSSMKVAEESGERGQPGQESSQNSVVRALASNSVVRALGPHNLKAAANLTLASVAVADCEGGNRGMGSMGGVGVGVGFSGVVGLGGMMARQAAQAAPFGSDGCAAEPLRPPSMSFPHPSLADIQKPAGPVRPTRDRRKERLGPYAKAVSTTTAKGNVSAPPPARVSGESLTADPETRSNTSHQKEGEGAHSVQQGSTTKELPSAGGSLTSSMASAVITRLQAPLQEVMTVSSYYKGQQRGGALAGGSVGTLGRSQFGVIGSGATGGGLGGFNVSLQGQQGSQGSSTPVANNNITSRFTAAGARVSSGQSGQTQKGTGGALGGGVGGARRVGVRGPYATTRGSRPPPSKQQS